MSLSALGASFTIINQIDTVPNAVQVHCRHKNREVIIDKRTLGVGEQLFWTFTPSVWGTSWYNCYLKWGGVNTDIVVWTDHFVLEFWAKRPCKVCVWAVRLDGFYEHDGGLFGPVVAHRPWIQ